MISQPKETCWSRDLHFNHRTNNHSFKNTTETRQKKNENLLNRSLERRKWSHNQREPDKGIKFISTILLTKTQPIQVISLRQSTKTSSKLNQMISRPKVTVEVVRFLSESLCCQSISIKHKKMRDFITTINRNGPNNLVNSYTWQIFVNRNW